ncbi:churchill protein-domain-containing protein [Pelagophyceae sp. CCMP2097]|nr:churchill protein-domain-containing protein [Pelagophyceae sp. CCMP2097]|mmetsp:Transcript_20842/g.71679  ORF Transcript_20842/g.71679 Transcript_20842/m.71679 type:complete len:194 (+) Transcript_20842:99-680(+)
MCPRCCKAPFSARGSVCLDGGCYFSNFAGCAHCGSRSMPRAARRNSSDDADDGEETEETEFDHECSECSHVVAKHWHKYAIDATTRRWIMECGLCGRGVDERPALAMFAGGASIQTAPELERPIDASKLRGNFEFYRETASLAHALSGTMNLDGDDIMTDSRIPEHDGASALLAKAALADRGMEDANDDADWE